MIFDPAKLVLLIVDPRAEARATLRGLADRVGIADIRLAADMAEAFERLRDGAVEAIVLDDAAGRLAIDFLTALRRRARGRVQETPVVLVTIGDGNSIRAARDAGVTELMAHPPTATVLRERLEEVILRPRRFIRSEAYVGPCRRRRRIAGRPVAERRGSAPATV